MSPFPIGGELKWSGFTTVPSDFFGANFHAWPNGYPTTNPEPSFSFSTYRLWDHRASDGVYILWANLNPSAGVYNWTQLDSIVLELESRGKRGWFTLAGTPQWAAIGAAFADPYGNPYGASPADPSAVSTFITALLTRYNSNGRNFWKYIEPWNEPAYDGTSGFYKGTAAQMAAIAKAVYQSAKAVDPTIIVTTPSDYSAGGYLAPFFSASDGSTGTGKDWFDVICVHPYYRYWDTDLYLERGRGTNVGVYMRALRSNLTAAGVSSSTIIWGESGYASSPSSSEHLSIQANPNKEFLYALWAKRQALGCIIEGVSAMLLYDYDGPLSLSGNPVTSTIISKAWNDIASLQGKSIYKIEFLNNQYIIHTNSGIITI